MTLPVDFPLSMSQVAAELDRPLPLSLLDPEVIALAGKTSGPIHMSDLLGKSAKSLINRIYVNTVPLTDTGIAGFYQIAAVADGVKVSPGFVMNPVACSNQAGNEPWRAFDSTDSDLSRWLSDPVAPPAVCPIQGDWTGRADQIYLSNFWGLVAKRIETSVRYVGDTQLTLIDTWWPSNNQTEQTRLINIPYKAPSL